MGGWTNVTEPAAVFTPEQITGGKLMLRALDTSSTKTRTVNGTVRLADQSRTGTPRQMQPGRAYLFAGVSDEITVGDLGVEVQHVSMRVKLAVDNQELLTFQDSTATAIKVSAGVLTFGGSLTASAIYVDGVAVSAASAGATLNDNGWHTLGIDLTAIDASDLVIGSDSSAFGNVYLSDFRLYTRTLTAAEALRIGSMGIGNADIGPTDAVLWFKGDEGAGKVSYNSGSLGSSANGTIVPASLTNFHNATVNDKFSFQNEVGSTRNFPVGHTRATVDSLGNVTVTASGLTSSASGDCVFNASLSPTRKYYLKFDVVSSAASAGFNPTGRASSPVSRYPFVSEVSQGDHTVTMSSGYITSTGRYHKLVELDGTATGVGVFRAHTGEQTIANLEIRDTAGNLVFARSHFPRKEANPSQDVLGNAIQYSGQAPHDPILSSKCLTFDGTADVLTYGSTGISVTVLYMRVKLAIDNQEILTLQNSTATSVKVAAGVLTFGGSLTVSEIQVDGSVVSAATAGVTLNDNGWHTLQLTMSAITASNLKISTDGSAFGQIFAADLKLNSTALLSPMCEGDGAIAHDVSGNQKHGTLTGTEAALWANQQNKVDTLVTDGATIATRYSGSGEYYNKGSRLTSGALTALSLRCWIYRAAHADAVIMSEWTESGTSRNWALQWLSSGKIRFACTDTGSVKSLVSTDAALAVNTWHRVDVTYNAGAVLIYVAGALVASTEAGTAATSIIDNAVPFIIAAYNNGSSLLLNGQLSDLVVDEAVWSASTIANAGIPSTAWRFRDGNGTEFNQALTAISPTGTPDRIIVPAGIMPVTVGPGVLMPGQSGDLAGGQANSPYAQQLADLLADTTYDQADDDEINVQFARVRTDGDDRIVTAIPGLTGTELANMQDYTT